MELLTLISTVICDLDPMGLLVGGAPEDEYEPEIREIGERITPHLSAEDVEELIENAMESAEESISEAIEELTDAIGELNETLEDMQG